LSVISASSSEPSPLSRALVLAIGDFGEVGLGRYPVFLADPAAEFSTRIIGCFITREDYIRFKSTSYST